MDPTIDQAEEKLELLSGDESVRELDEARARALRDQASSTNGSRAEGTEIGRAESRAEIEKEVREDSLLSCCGRGWMWNLRRK